MADEGVDGGPKFAYVLIGKKDDPLKVMVNTTCGSSIVSDFAKQSLVKLVDVKINEENVKRTMMASMPPPAEAGEGDAGDGEDAAAAGDGEAGEDEAPVVDVVAILSELRDQILDANTKLTDEGCTAAIGAEDKLEVRGKYSMAIFGQDEEGAEMISPLLTE